jgi:hypothetical protein
MEMSERATGFYWVIVGDEPEVAWWGKEGEGWSFIGGHEGQTEDVTVLSNQLSPPGYWRAVPHHP